MITEKEVPGVLGEELPELRTELAKNNSIFKAFRCFYNYTKQCAESGNIKKLKSCFVLASKLFRKGNDAVRSALVNVYMFSISSLIEIISPGQELFNKILPANLKKACLKHIEDLRSHNDRKDENCLFQFESIELHNDYYIPFNV